MSQGPSTEEILERMRVEVNRRTVASQTPNESQTGAKNEQTSQTADWQQEASMSAAPPPAREFSSLEREIETALEGTRQVGQINPRNPGVHNAVIQLVKKVMRRSLAWYTRPLHHFQGGVIRALQQILVLLKDQQESLQTEAQEHLKHAVLTDEIRSELIRVKSELQETRFQVRLRDDEIRSELIRVKSELQETRFQVRLRDDDIRSELIRVKNELQETKFQIRLRDRDIRRFFHDVQIGTLASSAEANQSPSPLIFPSGARSESEFDKFHCEELYRGDEALVSNHQKQYLGLFRGKENVLDAGCGRGEFLELLRDNGVSAKGVEIETDLFLLCREKALEVVQQDLLSYLESLPDQSLGGLFSAQVIQHLTANDQLRFVSLAFRKTRPESPVVFETINAQCVFAVMRSIFLYPTHVRPIHPEILKFAMESARFHNVGLRFSSPMSERRIPPLKLNGDMPQLAEFNHAIAELNELLYGNMDYAAIGWR